MRLPLALLDPPSDTGSDLGALGELEVSGLGILAVLLFAFVLFALLSGLRWLVGLVPMSKSRRAALSRARPVLEAVAAASYLLIAIPIVFNGYGELTPLILAVLLLGFVGVSWFAIRDFVNGMFIKAGELCEVGDHVRVDDQVGEVKSLGYRVLTLEGAAGEEVFIPYGRLSRRSIVRTAHSVGAYRHSFEWTLSADADALGTIAAIKQAASDSHWSSVARPPEVEARAAGVLWVQVFALGPEQGAAIEAQVRAQVPGRR